MRISDWSSDVCSSDLPGFAAGRGGGLLCRIQGSRNPAHQGRRARTCALRRARQRARARLYLDRAERGLLGNRCRKGDDQSYSATAPRSEEHTSELQSLMRNSYAVFCLKKNNTNKHREHNDEEDIK